MDSAPDFESGGWGFESLQDRFANQRSAIGLVVKYLVANEVPRVRFPDGAYLAPVAQLVAPRSYVPMVQGSSPCTSILAGGGTPTPIPAGVHSNAASYGHTMVKPPDPIRTPKLSTIGPAQYCGGGPRGNRRCLFVFAFCLTVSLKF